LILKDAWDLCSEYDICWWIDIEDMHENICEWVCEIFGLRIVMINGCWWIFVIYDYGIYWENCLWLSWDILDCNSNDKWMLLKLECIDGYGIVGKKYRWMSYDIFRLRIVIIKGCWNWNVLMVT
jgi:hypothetical protein